MAYNSSADQGDAAFVRMILSRTKKQQTGKGATKATLSLGSTTTDFFAVTPRGGKKNNPDSYVELLAYLPVSTWREPALTELTVSYTAFGLDNMVFKLPFTVTKKDFVSETIALNAQNTAIQTDTSPKRVAQIDTLNQILTKKNPDAVYQQGAFTPPTTATRRTSFFGDRRVYAYSNGKSSTTEHYGIDYGVPTGTPVYACAAGKVVMAEDRISTGWSVVIEHLPGLIFALLSHGLSCGKNRANGKTGRRNRQIRRHGSCDRSALALGNAP